MATSLDFKHSYSSGLNVDACNGRMCVLVHSLGFVDFLDIFRDKKRQIQL